MMSPYDPSVKFESRKLLTPFSPFNSGMSARDKVLERKKVILLKLEISEILFYASVYHTKDKKVIKYFLKSFKPETDSLRFFFLFGFVAGASRELGFSPQPAAQRQSDGRLQRPQVSRQPGEPTSWNSLASILKQKLFVQYIDMVQYGYVLG
jgi:hypothetical protein